MKHNFIFLYLIVTFLCFSMPVSAETEYLAVFLQGKKVGHAIHTRTVANSQVITSENINITLNRLGISIPLSIIETCIETIDGKPIGFELIQNTSIMQMNVKGVVSPEGELMVISKTGNNEQKRTLSWPDGAVMLEGSKLLQNKHGLKEGTQYSVKLFSPSILKALDVQIAVGPTKQVDLLGRVVELTEVTSKMNMSMTGQVTTTSYVDKNLKTLKSITPMPMMNMQMELISCAKEFALSSNDSLEVITNAFVDSPEPINNVNSAKSIRYYITPSSDINSFEIPSNDNQTVQQNKDSKFIVTVTPIRESLKSNFPYKGKDKSILEATMPTRYLQSDDKEIIDLAQKAVCNTIDTAEAVRRIESFVAEYIENKNFSVGYATALEVAKSREGDCSEHSVLAAAMCRSVGIPAQVVAGVVYVNDFQGMSGFGPHAWVQAYIGGKWIGIDPTFKRTNREGFDAGHIALGIGNGSPEDFFNVIFTLGQFKIDKIEIE